LIPN
jgi:hypothetical protein